MTITKKTMIVYCLATALLFTHAFPMARFGRSITSQARVRTAQTTRSNFIRNARSMSQTSAKNGNRFSDRILNAMIENPGKTMIALPTGFLALSIGCQYGERRAIQKAMQEQEDRREKHKLAQLKRFDEKKKFLEERYFDFIEFSGKRDAEEQYQQEFQSIVQAYKDKGYLAEDSFIMLKVMSLQLAEQLHKDPQRQWGNATATHLDYFVFAHETLLSDDFTQEERIALLAHEIGHIVFRKKVGDTMHTLLFRNKWEEILVDIISTALPGVAAGAAAYHTKCIKKRGDSNGSNGSHPWQSNRVWGFDKINRFEQWVKHNKDEKVAAADEETALANVCDEFSGLSIVP